MGLKLCIRTGATPWFSKTAIMETTTIASHRSRGRPAHICLIDTYRTVVMELRKEE
jgi:hypothetical protein